MIGRTMIAAAALALAVPAVADAGSRTFGWQGSGGRGGSGTVTRSYDPSTGTVHRQGSYTSNRGRSWSSESVGGCANGVCGRSSVITGPRGGTTTRDTEWRRNGDGSASGTTTWTGPAGRSRTVERWIRVTPGQ